MALAAWQATIVDEAGNVQAGASIEVRREATGALAAIYEDRDGATPLSNPFTADADGFARFYAAAGACQITATSGGFSRTWRHVAFGTLSEYDEVPSTLVRYERTPAEVAAGVTPVNYAYAAEPILYGDRYGFNGDGSTLNDTAMANAISVIAEAGGGTLILRKGTYLFSEGFELPESMEIWGAGRHATVLKANGAFTLLTLNGTTSGRNVLRSLSLEGTSKTGTGLQIGDTAHSGQHRITDVRITSFSVGVRLAAALWTSFDSCVIDGNVNGVDFNAGSTSMFSTTITFRDCVIRANDRSGVTASNVPVRNISIRWVGGSVENNCSEDPTTYPQFFLGACGPFSIDTVYFEYNLDGSLPDAINAVGLTNGEIGNCYFNGSDNGIISTSGGCSDILIRGCNFDNTTTKCVDLPSCQRITVGIDNDFDQSVNVDHATSVVITQRIAQITTGSFTATMTGCTTSPTGTVEYTINGDAVTLEIPSISGTSNSTAATLTGVPTAIRPLSNQSVIGVTTDNGTSKVSQLDVNAIGTVTLYNGLAANGFTASGTKGVGPCTVTYRLS